MTKADEEMYGDTLNKLGIDLGDRKRLMRFVDWDLVALKLSYKATLGCLREFIEM